MKNALFKFGTAESTARILRNGRLFITSPLDFNDPFEMRPAWTNSHEDCFRHDQAAKERSTFGRPISESPSSRNVANQIGLADRHNEPVFAALHEQFRVLCWVKDSFDSSTDVLSSKRKTILMWSHYADSFQGACLIVDPTKMNNGLRKGGYSISYRPSRRYFSPSSYNIFLGQEHKLQHVTHDSSEIDNMIDLLTAKAPVWRYENEVRFIYDIRKFINCEDYIPCRIKPQSNDKFPTFRDAVRLPPDAVKGVVFGVDILLEDVEAILNILSEPRYEHVSKYWSDYHPDQYMIRYVKWGDDDILTMQKVRNRTVSSAKGHSLFEDGKSKYIPSKKGTTYDMDIIIEQRKKKG